MIAKLLLHLDIVKLIKGCLLLFVIKSYIVGDGYKADAPRCFAYLTTFRYLMT